LCDTFFAAYLLRNSKKLKIFSDFRRSILSPSFELDSTEYIFWVSLIGSSQKYEALQFWRNHQLKTKQALYLSGKLSF